MLQTIWLHARAPTKPGMGQPCNGCGVCCAAELCPVGRQLFGGRDGPCPALVWQQPHGRYGCGVLVEPGRYLPWLPSGLHGLAARWFARRIAVGLGCDSDAELSD